MDTVFGNQFATHVVNDTETSQFILALIASCRFKPRSVVLNLTSTTADYGHSVASQLATHVMNDTQTSQSKPALLALGSNLRRSCLKPYVNNSRLWTQSLEVNFPPMWWEIFAPHVTICHPMWWVILAPHVTVNLPQSDTCPTRHNLPPMWWVILVPHVTVNLPPMWWMILAPHVTAYTCITCYRFKSQSAVFNLKSATTDYGHSVQQ